MFFEEVAVYHRQPLSPSSSLFAIVVVVVTVAMAGGWQATGRYDKSWGPAKV